MGKATVIAWCESTFNPWIGCTKIGPGCDHCYAEFQDSRKRWDGGKTHWGAGVPRYRTSHSNWAQPLAWNRAAEKAGKRHRVFCASLADVFDNEVPEEWRTDLWFLIRATPHLQWLLVTKRVGNAIGMVPMAWLGANGFPPNVRLLITVVDQEEADRDIPKLLALTCKNGISYEPALGPIDWWQIPVPGTHGDMQDMREIGWIIVGGESGSKARPFNLAWARSTIAQCKAAGVPVFCKQLGSCAISEDDGIAPSYFDSCGDEIFLPRGKRSMDWRNLKDRAGADPAEWPEDLRVQQFPT